MNTDLIKSFLEAVVNDDATLSALQNGDYEFFDQFVGNDEDEISPKVKQLMDKYFITKIGGKTVVINRDNYNDCMNFSNFKDFYSNLIDYKVVKKEVKKKMVEETIEISCASEFLNKYAERFNEVVFKPSGKVKDGQYNFFKGWSCEPKEGDCSLYLNHIRDNICSKDEDLYNYLLDWMAQIIQEPENKIDKAIVLRGDQGTGKGVLVKFFGSLLGDAYHHTTSISPLVSRFNSELVNRLLTFADECTWGGKKSEGSSLKVFISEDTMNFEHKGKDKVTLNNFSRLIIASNHEWVVPVESGDRRYVVIDVNDNVKENKEYFNLIHKQMNNGGKEALLHLLMNRNISNRDWSIKPHTDAIDDQKLLTLEPHEQWIYESITGSININLTPWSFGFNKKMGNDEIYSNYVSYIKEFHPSSYIKPSREISRFLTKLTGSPAIKNNGKTLRIFSTNIKDQFEKYTGTSNKIWD